MRGLWGRLKQRFNKQDENKTEATRPSRGSKGARPESKSTVAKGARLPGSRTEQSRGDGDGDAKERVNIFRRFMPHKNSKSQDSRC